MAQLERLRARARDQARLFTSVKELCDFIRAERPEQSASCQVRLCYWRGHAFGVEGLRGTHLEFLDADSAPDFDECCRIMTSLPASAFGSEVFRITVWRNAIDLTAAKPGEVYVFQDVHNLRMFNDTPQGCISAASFAQAVADPE